MPPVPPLRLLPQTYPSISAASLDISVRSAEQKISSYNEATTYPASSVTAAVAPVLAPFAPAPLSQATT